MEQNDHKRFGLLGKTLGHSFSKAFFDKKFLDEKINATFENIELADENALATWLKSACNEFSGVSVTIPYKETVIPYLDELSPEAKAIGAVNCIHFQDGKSIGHNTDAFGFGQSIKPFLRNIHERALLLGTGGASKAVAYTLKNLGITVGYLSRTPKDDQMVFSYDQANEIMVKSFPMIVNCTPIGTSPKIDEKPNFPIELVGEDHFVVDLIYNPAETLFLKLAKENGADTLNGLSMLQQQALKAWEIWNS
ncbi:shikimate dehydrogenase [Brumimicrobium salinarum]|uniref:Shikimate dehydrogenase n=1 Tax=Brumimicrobium salinarum TaxID=2058658 RepID=A0A2I0R2J8_9FLAO|nr:shikimate dehydrogenase [Brumimicrobium salinarum]PKR80813.1 shikimate dehydrogenase [Brumimicrobium salinarum]